VRFDKAVGCTPFLAPSLDDPVVSVPSQALNELLAAQKDLSAYCTNLLTVGVPRLQLDQALLTATPSPAPDVANNFFTFECQRFNFRTARRSAAPSIERTDDGWPLRANRGSRAAAYDQNGVTP
jgi:hypothetical protein